MPDTVVLRDVYDRYAAPRFGFNPDAFPPFNLPAVVSWAQHYAPGGDLHAQFVNDVGASPDWHPELDLPGAGAQPPRPDGIPSNARWDPAQGNWVDPSSGLIYGIGHQAPPPSSSPPPPVNVPPAPPPSDQQPAPGIGIPIVAPIVHIGPPGVPNPIDDALRDLTDAVHAIHVPDIGGALAGLVEPIVRPAERAIEALGAVPGEIATATKGAVKDVVADLTGGVDELVQGVEQKVTDAIAAGKRDLEAVLEKAHSERPEDRVDSALEGFALSTAAGVAAHGIALAGEGVYFTKNLGLNSLAGLVGRFSDWDAWIKAVWGNQVDAAVVRPLSYHWHKVWRPEVPDKGLLRELVRRRVIDAGTYVDWMGYHGMSDAWITRELDTVWREVTIRDLALVGQLGPLDPARVHDVLERQGYRDEDIDLVAPALIAKPTATERREYQTLANTLFNAGAITEAQLRDAYARTLVHPDWIDPLVALHVADAQRAIVADQQKTLEEFYNDDLLDDQELRDELTQLGIRAAIVESTVQRLSAKKNKKSAAATKTATKKAKASATADQIATLEAEYQDDAVSFDELVAQLAQLMGDATAASSRAHKLAQKKAQALEATKKKLLAVQARDDARAQRQQIIDAARAQRAQLAADARAKRAELVAAKDAFSLTDIEDGFKDGVLSLDEADQLLQAKGVSQGARDLKLQHWIVQLTKEAQKGKKTAPAATGGAS